MAENTSTGGRAEARLPGYPPRGFGVHSLRPELRFFCISAAGLPGGDLRPFVKELNQALRGRGGGKPEFVQGSVSASRAEIEKFFAAH